MSRPPSGSLWVHEIKHDGYRLMVRRDGLRVRCFTRNGNDWADRFPSIVEAALRIKAQSFLIDGEAMIIGDDGTPDFHALRSRSREAMLVAFDLIEHNGNDLRDLPLLERKQRLARLIGNPEWRAIQYGDHLTGDGPTVFKHVCRMGLEGIVSKRMDAPYRSWAVEDVAQVEEPGERGSAPGARRGLALASPGVGRLVAEGGLIHADDAEPRRTLAACQDIGSILSNKGLHFAQHRGELAARRLGAAIDVRHYVLGIDRNLHSAPLLADRARDSPLNLTGHDG